MEKDNFILINERQRRFADLWMLTGNGCLAYKQAGYKINSDETARVNASRLLTNANVLAYIQTRQNEFQEHTGITLENLTAELLAILARAMQDVPVLDNKGNPIGVYKYDGMTALHALNQLANLHGLFPQPESRKRNETTRYSILIKNAGEKRKQKQKHREECK